MFGIGAGELLVLFVIALVVLGPERLPSLARDVGKVMNDLRRTSDDLRSEFLRSDEVRPRPVSPPPAVESIPGGAATAEARGGTESADQRDGATPQGGDLSSEPEPSGEEPTAFDQEAQRRADEARARPDASTWTAPADRPEPDRWG